MVGEQAEQRRAGEERRVADRRHDADPAGGAQRVVGRRAHADREAERRAQAPDDDAEADQHHVAAEDDEQDADERGRRGAPEHRAPGRSGRARSGRVRRPANIELTKSVKPATPTQCRTSYPSISASESQSLAAPSESANASTMTPIARVRGSRHGEHVDGAAVSSWVSVGGR